MNLYSENPYFRSHGGVSDDEVRKALLEKFPHMRDRNVVETFLEDRTTSQPWMERIEEMEGRLEGFESDIAEAKGRVHDAEQTLQSTLQEVQEFMQQQEQPILPVPLVQDTQPEDAFSAEYLFPAMAEQKAKELAETQTEPELTGLELHVSQMKQLLSEVKKLTSRVEQLEEKLKHHETIKEELKKLAAEW